MLFGSQGAWGRRSRRSFFARVNRESYSGLRDRIDGCVRSHSSCYRWRTHHFKACFHNTRSHQCPHRKDRREQTYNGEKAGVPWTLAAASGRLFISVHDPHSTTIFEGQQFWKQPVHSCIDPGQCHLNLLELPGLLVLWSDKRTSPDAAAKPASCCQYQTGREIPDPADVAVVRRQRAVRTGGVVSDGVAPDRRAPAASFRPAEVTDAGGRDIICNAHKPA